MNRDFADKGDQNVLSPGLRCCGFGLRPRLERRSLLEEATLFSMSRGETMNMRGDTLRKSENMYGDSSATTQEENPPLDPVHMLCSSLPSYLACIVKMISRFFSPDPPLACKRRQGPHLSRRCLPSAQERASPILGAQEYRLQALHPATYNHLH